MLDRLEILQANKGQFADGGKLFEACKSNKELRCEITILSNIFLKRSVQGCQNCYMDAYIELININLKKAMEILKCQFQLLAGALLFDVVNYDNDLLCSNANITNELALYHLKTNPACEKYFQGLPDDWKEQVEAFVIPGTEPELTDEEKAELAEKAELQDEAEKVFVAELAELLKAGTTKTAIKEKYKEIEKVGDLNITQRLLAELIKRAESLIHGQDS